MSSGRSIGVKDSRSTPDCGGVTKGYKQGHFFQSTNNYRLIWHQNVLFHNL